MNPYVTGETIKKLREECGLTQAELANRLNVSDKAVSRWETGRGYPDISLLGPLAAALSVDVPALLTGEIIRNGNRSANMTRMKVYVCPVCGNALFSTGEAAVSCCGIPLPPLEAEAPDGAHALTIEKVEDEYYVTMAHEMTKEHAVSFMAAVRDDGCEIRKLYPEGPCEARFKIARTQLIYAFCNRHGLFRIRPGR